MADVRADPGQEEAWTCGKGLAAHAAIPAGIAELLRGLAANLHAHVPTIDVADPHGEAERRAYVGLAEQYDAVAAQLSRAALEMEGCRDLPAARHHEEALADPALLDTFRRFVAVETELAALLARSAEEDAQLLDDPPAGE